MKKPFQKASTPVNSVENSQNPVENSRKTVHNPVENSVENPVDSASSANPAAAHASASPTNSARSTGPANAAHAASSAAATQRISELTADLQRTRADFENFRKQTELQKTQAMSAARFATVEKFLPLVDDFNRAIASYPNELAPLAKNFDKLMASLNLQPIDSAPGTVFNPDFHDAISVDDGEGDTEVIAATLRPGYLYEGSVLRPAMVKVTRR